VTFNASVFVSVDIEASGPIPGVYSMLAIGACTVDGDRAFSCEVKPLNDNADPKAMEIVGMSLDALKEKGSDPSQAMQRFADWLRDLCPAGAPLAGTPLVFVGLNAPFDWSFVNYYFHRFAGGNPFGYTAIDLKAYYMGVTGCRWDEATSSAMSRVLKPQLGPNHNALQDARFQAELYRLIRGKVSHR